MTYLEFVYHFNQMYNIIDATPEERIAKALERIADAMEKENQKGEKENG